MIKRDHKTYKLCLLFNSLIALAFIISVIFVRAQADAELGVKQVEWPDTYAGRWAKAFFKAFNTDGTDALRLFITENYSEAHLKETPVEKELEGPLTIRDMIGKVTVFSVISEGDFAIEALVETKNVGWVKYKIELSPDPPHDLIGMGPYAEASPPEGMISGEAKPSAPNTEDYSGWKDLSDLLEQIRHDAGIPGLAAAIVHRGKIIDKAITGVRRYDRSDHLQVDDQFHLGSATKIVTGVMIGKLVEDRVLQWDLTIGEVLQDIPMRSEYRSVTLGQLMQFRGGVPLYPSGGEFAGVMDLKFKSERSPADGRAVHVRQVLTEKPVGDPDEVKYSNSAYVLAAHMAERITKRSWEDLVRSLVFEPLEMQSASFGWPATTDCPDQPLGHYGTPPDIKLQEIDDDPFGVHTYAGPAGDVNCSIEDFARLAVFKLRALNGQSEELNAETVRRYWEPAKTDELKYGFYGSGGTFMAMIVLYPDSDLGIVAAANHGLHAMPYLKKTRDAIHQRMVESSDASP